jgi:hypothetical protein
MLLTVAVSAGPALAGLAKMMLRYGWGGNGSPAACGRHAARLRVGGDTAHHSAAAPATRLHVIDVTQVS